MAVTEMAQQVLEQVTAACRTQGRRQLTEVETYRVLEQWRIPVAPYRLVSSAQEAAEAAQELGGRVAVKVVSPDIAHKTEAGCVKLGIRGRAEAEGAFSEVMANACYHSPDARIDGVLIQQMAPPGVELIAGGLWDPAFGPVLMVGLGGIFTEVLKDVAFRLAPVGPAEVKAALRELKGFPLLCGARGKPPVDLEALAEALAALSRLLASWEELAELDLNPLIAHRGGVVAVDGLVKLKEPNK